MNSANPLWGAPRIHGELLKIGIEVSQATVAKYMVRRVGTPSPTWRSFLTQDCQLVAERDDLESPIPRGCETDQRAMKEAPR